MLYSTKYYALGAFTRTFLVKSSFLLTLGIAAFLRPYSYTT
ncbi:hypothetical protein HMPREF3214_00692 [Alloscardovia omnicolens]|nr:hypothetical protein HMPREF3214_00692 [Alloscardovia omnicolens]